MHFLKSPLPLLLCPVSKSVRREPPGDSTLRCFKLLPKCCHKSEAVSTHAQRDWQHAYIFTFLHHACTHHRHIPSSQWSSREGGPEILLRPARDSNHLYGSVVGVREDWLDWNSEAECLLVTADPICINTQQTISLLSLGNYHPPSPDDAWRKLETSFRALKWTSGPVAESQNRGLKNYELILLAFDQETHGW